MSNREPKYPVYIPSKGRARKCHTANFFIKDGVDFKIVIEPQEFESYSEVYDKKYLLQLPFRDLGKGSMPARNWIREDSIKKGFDRHWQFDDNIYGMKRLHKGKRIPVNSKIGIVVVEDFTDRYENIGVSGFNYTMFVLDTCKKPFYLNTHVYSACLVNNRMPYKWRLKYNEDTDLCLQVLTNGLCTVAFNVFNVRKVGTMAMKGGNTDELYKGDGRLKMARSLEAMWPDYVRTIYRFGRPQHYINKDWKDFKHPLIRRKDIDWDNLQPNNYGLKLVQKKEIKSPELREFYENNQEGGD